MASDPDNTGLAASMGRHESKVYRHAGLPGQDSNWHRLCFVGIKHAEALGACVDAWQPGLGRLLGCRVIAAGRSGAPFKGHLVLERKPPVDITFRFPGEGCFTYGG
ncbi:MAG: hypothetical protein NZ899_09495 [Thermoguttaceae bacterium]|nr:hypothetical protein [Thermoguttaceae bacterium]MDW8079315.1 hypothetical protein [Thermoguttaceae bacterium]